ncbi:hypothetical protein [Nocardia sp. 348MFTsu5.1]|uniref:hypothetical protein n=1 Tax=Nocardia sp. 348MFTsu5.1 TaxID=1172185 RepID=UPI000367C531|nr:hypothetical protein [Nocardia sp. 348MFTsu5.1]
MSTGKANEFSKEQRRIAGSRPDHTPTPLPLRTNGVVTNVNITACGEQRSRIKVVASGTRVAMLQVEFPGVTMQFTSCEQVQLVLGLFAIARQARMGMSKLHRLPGVMTESNVEVQTTMMWTRVPMGAAARDQFTHPVTHKVSPYVRLTIAPLTFALMDTTAIETMVAAMKKAHRLAIATFDDGEEFARNSAAPSWRPRAQHSYRITGTGWLTRGPTAEKKHD